jgi:hypothetical protein
MDYVITFGPRSIHDSATEQAAATTKATCTINATKARSKPTAGSSYLHERDTADTSNGLHSKNKA